MSEIFPLLTEALKFLQFWNKNKAGDVIVRTAAIYDEMHKLVHTEKYGIHRFLILKCHNGGGDISSNTPAYSTCVHEDCRRPMSSVKKDYQRIQIDGAYIRMLKEIYLNGSAAYDVEELEDGSLLRDIYEKEGVKFSKVVFLRHTKGAFWLCTISTANELNHFTDPETKLAIRLAINNIQRLIK